MKATVRINKIAHETWLICDNQNPNWDVDPIEVLNIACKLGDFVA